MKFAKGNSFSVMGGKARAEKLAPEKRKEIAQAGFSALVAKHFEGDRKCALNYLVRKGQYTLDEFYIEQGMGAFADPGTPAQFLAAWKSGQVESILRRDN